MQKTGKSLNRTSLQLHRQALQHLRKVIPGMTVTCEKGIILLTEPDDLRDYTLRPGHQVMIKKRGDVLVEAIEEAELSIIYPN